MTDFKINSGVKGQQPVKRKNPEQELKQYMLQHKCTRAEAEAALKKLHGGQTPQKPQQAQQQKGQLTPMQMEANVRAYAEQHKCSMQQAAQALGYPPPQPPQK